MSEGCIATDKSVVSRLLLLLRLITDMDVWVDAPPGLWQKDPAVPVAAPEASVADAPSAAMGAATATATVVTTDEAEADSSSCVLLPLAPLEFPLFVASERGFADMSESEKDEHRRLCCGAATAAEDSAMLASGCIDSQR